MKKIHAKDPGSAITHFIGMIAAIAATAPLLLRAAQNSLIHVIAFSIFMLSMILLYAASTTYHTFDISPSINKRLKKLDHAMISVLIAGSYTPVCLIVLEPPMGYFLCALVWTIALAGIIIKMVWIYCPKWFSSVLYIAMGWLCIIAFGQLLDNLTPAAFTWLLIGGILYTVGGIIYALKLSVFNSLHKNFGSHEIFHVFVMAGSFCHFMFMFLYVANMPLSH
ncbi:hemolysin-III related [Clostridiales bacterium CHKCI001]|nr:hemolysin-III related [Clostridiales bacterium CHKCI001]